MVLWFHDDDDKFFFLRLEEGTCLSRKIDDDEPAN